MYKKTIKYEDFDGNEREEDFYFNISEAELLDWELSNDGGLDALIGKIIQTKNVPMLMNIFKDVIARSYGEKSLDGKRFTKSPEILENFKSTNAYSWLFMELATNTEFAIEFIKNIVPGKIRAKMNEDTNVTAIPTNTNK